MITIGQLIELLQKEDPERVVILSEDSEGNGYSPLARIWAGAYRAESGWSGEVGLERLTPEYEDIGYSEDDVIKGKPAIILSPTR